ncbi:hypothetical protein L3N51_01660 [Metallosphaera sp. J1]|uniref:hypothetical protein n=1 Tax=Metallosphaera javensis (ex Hofmann et al. 2022) TaxID=99938 RepID=UPI001EDEEEC6|nr:hypothetical protein [Metallosphaera javensis (ex Hofmann et al. 2022)]MCG3109369.1 hypothetical protein [Metallosphaera javensis (ex Hofmann et al. 2022)]
MDRRLLIYSSIFSVASFGVAAVMSLSLSLYALSVFLDPILTLTIPLIIISVGIQLINQKNGPLLVGLISAILYGVFFLLFLSATFLVVGLVVEVVSRKVGYRGFRAVMINTTLAGGLAGVLSVIFGFIFLGIPNIHDLPLLTLVFSLLYFGESAVMGIISNNIGRFLIKSGVIK